MLCERGDFKATALTTSGTLAVATLPARSLAASLGLVAATMALTTATPSRLLAGADDRPSTLRALSLLTPPMQTVGMALIVGRVVVVALLRAERMLLTPLGPMMDFVSFLVDVAKTVPRPR